MKSKMIRITGNMILWVTIATAIVSCIETRPPGTSVDDISWMEGSWRTDDSAYYENWQMTGDSITGEGFTLTQGDTTFKEELVIINEENTLVYKALVHTQKFDKVAHFRLTTRQSDSLVFENREHDFPNRITYVKRSDDRIFIRVESTDGERGFNIDMKRIEE